MAARVGKQLVDKKLTKSERKLFKKQARKFFSLTNKEENLQISEKPTKHLVVGNGGLICGMDRDSLFRLFGRYGRVESLYMIPGKEFALLSFKNESEAIEAYDHIHGRPLEHPEQAPRSGITLYLAYLMDSFDKSNLLKWNVKPVLPCQNDLHPPGLVIVENFITEVAEKELIEYFKIESSDAEGGANRSMKHRKVKHYGYEFIYGKNDIDKNNPLEECIPDICQPVIDKMIHEKLIAWKPDQMTVNQYDIGQGIPPHTDTHSAFEDGIISLSLGSQVVMEFCHPDGKELSLILPSCSLIIMKGESRYLWTHGITPRKTDIVIDTTSHQLSNIDAIPKEDHSSSLTLKERGFRISLTFRKVLKDNCRCKYPEKCDSQGFKTQISDEKASKETVFIPKSDTEAQELEKAHVYQIYDEIADHFSDTRHSPWPKVGDFLRGLPSHSLVADVGCGNGKYLGVNKDIATFGSDRSINLIKICRERGHCAIVSDILSLPYRSDSFDACISIAVIHHLSTEERRASAIREILRIVKPNGLVLIYVWAQEQNKHEDNSGSLKENVANVARSSESDNVFVEKHVEARHDKDDASVICANVQDSNHLIEGSGPERAASLVDVNTERGMNESVEIVNKSRITKGMKNSTKLTSKGITATEEEVGGKETDTEKDDRKMIQINETRNVFQQQDLLVPWHFRGKQEKRNKQCCDNVNGVNSSRGEQVYHRFYHVFVEGELEELCANIGGTTVVKSYHDKGNWCIILRKL